jgi:hypothetical protein
LNTVRKHSTAAPASLTTIRGVTDLSSYYKEVYDRLQRSNLAASSVATLPTTSSTPGP